MKEFRPEDWHFFNMNSPADLQAEYKNGQVKIKEYAPYRDGHMLVSASNFDLIEKIELYIEICKVEAGVAIGLYFGNGGYEDYLSITACQNRVGIRVPNGVPVGDTFRQEGPLREYEIAGCEYFVSQLVSLGFSMENSMLQIFANGKKILQDIPITLPFAVSRMPAVFVKAVNEGGKNRESQVILGTYDLRGKKAPNPEKITVDVEFCGPSKEKKTYSKWERENIPQELLKRNLPYVGLNGEWEFSFQSSEEFPMRIQVPFSWQSLLAFGKEKYADSDRLYQADTRFCTASETGECGWYRRHFVPQWDGDTEIVFAAVSGTGRVWLDGKLLGCIVDSYNSSIFFAPNLEKGKEYTLLVKVEYEHSNKECCNGKQGFWFTDAPGIWQNVWIRKRNPVMVQDLLLENQKLQFHGENADVQLTANAFLDVKGQLINRVWGEKGLQLSDYYSGIYRMNFLYRSEITTEIRVFLDEHCVYSLELDSVHGKDIYDQKSFYINLTGNEKKLYVICETASFELCEITMEKISELPKIQFFWEDETERESAIPAIDHETGSLIAKVEFLLKDRQLWKPGTPALYTLCALVNGEEESLVKRHVGFRQLGVTPYDKEKGTYVTLNNQKYYIQGVLDQGYNPWGIYTYPCLRGNIPGSAEFDIRAAQECGYNLIRMHVKDNEPDWYTLCDELGMPVWDEIPANFYGTSQALHCQSMHKRQQKAAIRKHNYHPSVVICSLFNESWGITGDHEKSPWDDRKGQALIREGTMRYRKARPEVLAIDNSGYGKTSLSQILDYHSYPLGYENAREFFGRLEKMNYPGSVFNCYNQKMSQLVQKEEIRNLLQKTCSQNLQTMDFEGEEEQKGQPVLISEFVHTDRQEELLRIFSGFAGYIRMNIASQENEDTSPYTAQRGKRDFGFLNRKLEHISYASRHKTDLLFMDAPLLTKVKVGEQITIPVYVSLWSEKWQKNDPAEICFYWQVIEETGAISEHLAEEKIRTVVEKESPYLAGNVSLKVPEKGKGAYLFAEIRNLANGNTEEASWLQFEIEGLSMEKPSEIYPTRPEEVQGFLYKEKVQLQDRKLFWGFGAGKVYYRVKWPGEMKKPALIMEISSCNCMNGTKVEREGLKPGNFVLSSGERKLAEFSAKALSQNQLALFSNSSSTSERTVSERKMGIYGYGSHVCIPLPKDLNNGNDYVSLCLEAGNEGIVLYGNRMGRYGFNPVILDLDCKKESVDI